MILNLKNDTNFINLVSTLLFVCVYLTRIKFTTCYYSPQRADLVLESKISIDDACELSDEARKIKLTHHLEKVREHTQLKLQPRSQGFFSPDV